MTTRAPVTRRRKRPLALTTAVVTLTFAGSLGAGAAMAAGTKAPPPNIGLYGSSDPTYDGVFRQSLALLGVHAAGKLPDPTAVTWLMDQQCAGGGFSSYNPTPAKGCAAYDPTTYAGGIDTNATSLALQALLATGHEPQAARAAAVLRAAQDDDGGWPFIVGGGSSDPNSTGLVLSALAAAGDAVNPDGAAYLAGLQVGCGTEGDPTDDADRGGLSTPYSNGAPDVLGTVQAVPGLEGLSLVTGPAVGAWADGGPTFPCTDASASPSVSASVSPSVSPSVSASVSASPSAASADDVAAWAATWLAGQEVAGTITSNNLGWAILSLASTHSQHQAAAALYADLAADLSSSKAKGSIRALKQTDASPGALGLAALSAQVLGHHNAAVGFAAQAQATIAAAAASPSPSVSSSTSSSPTPRASPSASASSTGADGPTLPRTGGEPYVLVGGLVLLVAGTGLISLGARRRANALASRGGS